MASKLKSPKTFPRHLFASGEWISALVESAGNCSPDLEEHLIDPIRLCGIECLATQGRVPPHVDHEHALSEPMSYLLVLKSDGAILRTTDHLDFPLQPRMLVELNHRRRHSLIQAPGCHFVWLPLDTKHAMPLEEALAALHLRIEAMSTVQDRGRFRQGKGDADKVTWDGEAVWVNGSDGGAVGRFGRAGAEVLVATGETWMYSPSISIAEGSREAWVRFREVFRLAGVYMPDAACPRWVFDTESPHQGRSYRLAFLPDHASRPAALSPVVAYQRS